jgi:hypothetical protein
MPEPTMQDKLNELSQSELRSLCIYNGLTPGGATRDILVKKLLGVRGEFVWPAATAK